MNFQVRKNGTTLTEIVVAAVLVSSMASLIGSLVVRSGRMWQETRHVQFAMDELSNQLEILTSLDAKTLQSKLDSLTISNEFKSTLPDARLSGKLIEDEFGRRIELNLNWQRSVPALPVTLVGWVGTHTSDQDDDKKEPQS